MYSGTEFQRRIEMECRLRQLSDEMDVWENNGLARGSKLVSEARAHIMFANRALISDAVHRMDPDKAQEHLNAVLALTERLKQGERF